MNIFYKIFCLFAALVLCDISSHTKDRKKRMSRMTRGRLPIASVILPSDRNVIETISEAASSMSENVKSSIHDLRKRARKLINGITDVDVKRIQIIVEMGNAKIKEGLFRLFDVSISTRVGFDKQMPKHQSTQRSLDHKRQIDTKCGLNRELAALLVKFRSKMTNDIETELRKSYKNVMYYTIACIDKRDFETRLKTYMESEIENVINAVKSAMKSSNLRLSNVFACIAETNSTNTSKDTNLPTSLYTKSQSWLEAQARVIINDVTQSEIVQITDVVVSGALIAQKRLLDICSEYMLKINDDAKLTKTKYRHRIKNEIMRNIKSVSRQVNRVMC